MKRRIYLFLAFVFLLTGVNGITANAEESIKVLINNEATELNNKVLAEDGQVLVPLREIAEKLGYEVNWNQEEKKVTLNKDTEDFELTLNKNALVHNKKEETMENVVVIKGDNTYVPVEFFGNHFGTVAAWDTGRNTVSISEKRALSEDIFKMSADATVSGNLKKFMELYSEKQNMSGSVLVAKDNKVLLNEGFGKSDEALNIKANSQTKYGIGSMTKQFTATAIMQLVETGKVDLNDKVSKYIDGLKHGDEITVEQLLTHTSGLVNVTDLPDFYGMTDTTPQTIVDMMKNMDLMGVPGENFVYNNTGYILLGMIVEKVSGETLENYFNNNFFEKLNMLDTGSAYGEKEGDILATPYVGYIDHIVIDDKPLLENVYGAGNVYSTVEDIYRWSNAIEGEEILSKESKDKMFSGHSVMGENLKYGYGWMIQEDDGGDVHFHGGDTLGYAAMLMKLPETDVDIVVLTNRRLNNATGIAFALESIVSGSDTPLENIPEFPTKVDIKPEELKKYIGVYNLADPMTGTDLPLKVFVEENKLWGLVEGQEKFELIYKGENSFFNNLTDLSIEFVFNEEGKAIQMVYTQMGMIMKGYHEDYTPEEVVVAPETLEKYVGVYQLVEGFDLTITVADGNMYAQATGQDAIQVFPASDNVFEYTIINANIEFVTGEDGNVNSIVFTQDGNVMNGTRK
ncbi:MAG: serine hydrolase [Tissierellia bacterium]|nr:serine hydrolase [Tissierellia bacterium]